MNPILCNIDSMPLFVKHEEKVQSSDLFNLQRLYLNPKRTGNTSYLAKLFKGNKLKRQNFFRQGLENIGKVENGHSLGFIFGNRSKSVLDDKIRMNKMARELLKDVEFYRTKKIC